MAGTPGGAQGTQGSQGNQGAVGSFNPTATSITVMNGTAPIVDTLVNQLSRLWSAIGSH